MSEQVNFKSVSVPKEIIDILTPSEGVIGVLFHNLRQYDVFISFIRKYVSREEIVRFTRINDDRDLRGRKFSKVLKLTDWWLTKYSDKCDLIDYVLTHRKITSVDVNLDELLMKYKD